MIDYGDMYIKSVVNNIEAKGLDTRGSKLKTGNVLLLNSKSIQGTFGSSHNKSTRTTISCDVIPDRYGFLQFQSRLLNTPSESVKAINIFLPKDLSQLRNRLAFWIEGHLSVSSTG